jgi:penicillin-binding protein 2
MAGEGESRRMFDRRALFLGGIQAAAGVMLIGRMAWLSIFEAEKYALASEENRVSLRLIAPRRGWIVDATGEPLASNRPAYSVEIVPSLAGDLDAALDRIGRMLPISAEDRDRIHADARRLPASAPLAIAEDIGWDAFAALNLELSDQPGLQPVRSYVRHYPDGAAFGHLLGYVGRATAEQFKESRDPLYLAPGFRLGKDGVERSKEDVLRGTAGAQRVEITAQGKIVRDLETQPDTPGETVQLTIDRGLQAFTAARIGDDSASVVVIDCLTGDVKCLLSMPAFDPNVFSNRIPQTLWTTMQADDRKPLLNKVTQGLYVPGSTFKMVTALAALSEEVLPDETVTCGGRYRVGNNTWHCHARRGHGTVAMRSGIAKSCNVFFYSTARRIGPQAVADMARKLGLGQKFDIPMPVQRAGIVPDPAWKMERYDQKWSVADTLNTSIGQGYLTVNPLQLAVMTARIASGRLVEPRLTADGPAKSFAPLGIPDDYLEITRQGMADVVNGPGGTARSARLKIEGVQMAGKTGTAQVRRITAAERRRGVRSNASLPWKFRDHALFIAFAPADAPRYAVSVIVEHGASGSKAAAPIARDLLTYIYDREQAEKGLAALQQARERARLAREEAARRAAAEAAAAAAAPPAPAAAAQEPQQP